MQPSGYAVVNASGLVINVIMWDGESVWTPPEGCYPVPLGDTGAGIGWTYKDGEFIEPPAPEIPKEDLVLEAQQQKTSLISEASQQISILQDAVDLDMATDDETSMLLAWKKYRVLLNRVDTNDAPDIDWPKHP